MKRNWSVGLVSTKVQKPLVLLPRKFFTKRAAERYAARIHANILPGANFIPAVVDGSK